MIRDILAVLGGTLGMIFKFILIIALSYSARWELVDTMQRLARLQ